MMKLHLGYVRSPIGLLTLAWDEGALRALDYDGFDARFHALLESHYEKYELMDAYVPAQYRNALDAYFAGELTAIESIVVRTGGTHFQKEVWAALRTIPAGTTRSYGEVAQIIGKPGASRAVGRANGANPIGIVVPCHRVIGADGSLTGYGGGADRKEWLLEHERTHAPRLANASKPVQRSLSSIFI